MPTLKSYDSATATWKPFVGATSGKFLAIDTTVTVGTGGDFSTINDAIEFLSEYYPMYKKNGITAEISLLTGFVMQEQVLVDSIDLGWITITSVDATVTIARSYLTQRFGEEPNNSATEANMDTLVHVDNFPAFGAWNNATLPIIDVLFDMDATGDWEGRNGISATNQSSCYVKPYKGFINVGDTGIYVTQNSHGYAYRANFNNAGRGRSTGDLTAYTKMTAATCFRGSWLNVRQADLSNAANDALYTGSSSVVEALNTNFSGAGAMGIRVYANGRVNARDADISGCGSYGVHAMNNSIVNVGSADISSAGTYGIYAIENSIVNAQGATISGASTWGVEAQTNALVNIGGATVTSNNQGVIATRGSKISAEAASCTGNTADDLRAARGGIISATNSTGTLTNTANTLTADGIIFK